MTSTLECKQFAKHLTQQVALAAMVGLTYEWLPPILSDLRVSIPGIQVELSCVFPRDCVTLVAAKRADFAIAALDVTPSRIAMEVLWRAPFLPR